MMFLDCFFDAMINPLNNITEAGNTLKQVAAAAGYQKALMNLTPEYERLQGHLTNTSAIVKKVREDKRADLKKAQALINS